MRHAVGILCLPTRIRGDGPFCSTYVCIDEVVRVLLGAELARLSLHWFRRLRLVVLGLSAGALVALTILLWDRRCDIREFGLVHCKISREATPRTLNNTELISRISVEKSLLADFLLVLLIFLL